MSSSIAILFGGIDGCESGFLFGILTEVGWRGVAERESDEIDGRQVVEGDLLANLRLLEDRTRFVEVGQGRVAGGMSPARRG